MVRFLPPHPSLDHLKNESKALLKAHQSGDIEVCDLLRHLHRFREASSGSGYTRNRGARAHGRSDLRDAVIRKETDP